MCFARLQKSQTSPGKVVVTFSDTVFGDGPREVLTGLHLLEMGASNSSMAHSYEYILVTSLQVRQDRFIYK